VAVQSPKAMAHILTQEGFMRWTEGKALRLRDFKELAALSLRKDKVR